MILLHVRTPHRFHGAVTHVLQVSNVETALVVERALRDEGLVVKLTPGRGSLSIAKLLRKQARDACRAAAARAGGPRLVKQSERAPAVPSHKTRP